MAAIKALLSVIRTGSDDVAQLLATPRFHDEFLDAIRAGNVDDFLTRSGAAGDAVRNSDIFTNVLRLGDDAAGVIDDIDAGIRNGRVNSDAMARFFGGADNIPAGLTGRMDDAAGAFREAAEQHGRTANTVDDALGLKNRVSLALLRTRNYALIAGASLIGVEFASGHALSSWLANRTLDVAHGLEDIDPELAQRVAEQGLETVMFAADVADTSRNALFNYAATMLEEEGREDEAVVLRVVGVISSANIYAGVLIAEEGERAEEFIKRLDDAGISREQLTTCLNNNPHIRNRIEDTIGVSLATSLPGLTERTDAPESSLREDFAQAARRAEEISRVNALSGEGLSAEFNNIVAEDSLGMFSSMNMFLASVFDAIGIDFIADHFKRQIVMDSAMDDFNSAVQNITNTVSSPEADVDQQVANQQRPQPTFTPGGPS
jgi:hypothetical protein